jgi:hypothetical protein
LFKFNHENSLPLKLSKQLCLLGFGVLFNNGFGLLLEKEKPLFLERKRGECSIQSLISQDYVLLELAPSARGGVAEASSGQSLCSS